MYKIFISVFFVVLVSVAVLGQERNVIEGQVINETDGTPISGASIRVEKRGISTQSDVEGNFKINTDQREAVLQISYLGYIDQVIRLDLPLNKDLVVSLAQAEGLLDVVEVNTGYQSIPRERAPGSFVQLDSELLNRKVSTDILSRLEDVTPGLIFNKGIGRRSSESPITIRGQSTIQANSAPLIIIDNFPYEGDLDNINPNDVESISVLKDAAAASIWGARSGNGVIVITTKKGKYGARRNVMFNSNVTIGNKPDQFYQPQISTGDFIEIERMLFEQGYYKSAESSINKYPLSPVVEMLIEGGKDKDIEALKNNDIRNEYDRYLNRASVNQQYAFNIRGGGVNQQYYFSAGYDNNRENLIGNSLDRFTLSAKNTYSFFDAKLEFSSDIHYGESNRRNNGFSSINITTPYGSSMPLYPYATLVDGAGRHLPTVKNYRLSFLEEAENEGLLNWDYTPLDELRLSDNVTKSAEYRINTSVKYKIIPSLNGKILYQHTRSVNDNRHLQSADSYYARNEINRLTIVNPDGSLERPIPLGGIVDYANGVVQSHNLRGQLDFSAEYRNKHRIDALGGVEIRDQLSQYSKNRLYGYDDENATNGLVDYISSFTSYINPYLSYKIPSNQMEQELSDRFLSYYSNMSYSYSNRYILSLSGRLDQSNLFGVKTNQRGVPLYSVGGSWNISEEGFYQMQAVPFLRFRATYGYNGNVDKRTSAYVTASYRPRDPQSDLPFAEIQNPPNPELRWEKVRLINYAIDFSAKGNVLTGSIEYYRKKGIDLIGASPYAPSSGITKFIGNYANTTGGGWDVVLNSRILNGRFKWINNFFLSTAKEVVSNYKENAQTSFYVSGITAPLEGRPLYSIYSYPWAGLDPSNGNPQGYLDGKASTDYSAILRGIKPDDLVYEGSARPTKFGSIRNTFSYRQFSLSFNVSYRLGYYFRRNSVNYNALLMGHGGHDDYNLRWKKTGDEQFTQIPSMPSGQDINRMSFYMYSEALVEKGDHVRLQDVSLSYDLLNSSFKRLPMSALKVYLYANNLGVLWKATDKNLDPEYAVSFYPPPRSISIGLKVDF